MCFSEGCRLKSESEVAQLCPTLWDPMDCSLHQAPPSMGFSSQSTGVGCHFLLQGIFLTRGSNPGLPPCRQTLYPLSHQGRYRLRGRLTFKAALALPQAGYYSSGKGRFPVEVLWQWGSRGLGHPSSSEFSMKSEMLPLAPREFPLPFLLWSMNCWG